MPPPSPQSLPALLATIRSLLPSSLPKSASYILPASTLTALGHPTLLGPLFTQAAQLPAASSSSSSSASPLSNQQRPASATQNDSAIPGSGGAQAPVAGPAPGTPEYARHVSLQLRDVLMKEWTLIGIPLVISAVPSLAAAERAAGLPTESVLSAKYGGSGSGPDGSTGATSAAPSTTAATAGGTGNATLDISPNAPITARGSSHLHALYRNNLPAIMSTWGSHEADFTWLEESVIYGLFLSDHSVLTPVETSLVTMSGIMAQGLKAPTLWHIRGLRRLGVRKEDVEGAVKVVQACARWVSEESGEKVGKNEEEWGAWVEEVEREVGPELAEKEGRS